MVLLLVSLLIRPPGAEIFFHACLLSAIAFGTLIGGGFVRCWYDTDRLPSLSQIDAWAAGYQLDRDLLLTCCWKVTQNACLLDERIDYHSATLELQKLEVSLASRHRSFFRKTGACVVVVCASISGQLWWLDQQTETITKQGLQATLTSPQTQLTSLSITSVAPDYFNDKAALDRDVYLADGGVEISGNVQASSEDVQIIVEGVPIQTVSRESDFHGKHSGLKAGTRHYQIDILNQTLFTGEILVVEDDPAIIRIDWPEAKIYCTRDADIMIPVFAQDNWQLTACRVLGNDETLIQRTLSGEKDLTLIVHIDVGQMHLEPGQQSMIEVEIRDGKERPEELYAQLAVEIISREASISRLQEELRHQRRSLEQWRQQWSSMSDLSGVTRTLNDLGWNDRHLSKPTLHPLLARGYGLSRDDQIIKDAVILCVEEFEQKLSASISKPESLVQTLDELLLAFNTVEQLLQGENALRLLVETLAEITQNPKLAQERLTRLQDLLRRLKTELVDTADGLTEDDWNWSLEQWQILGWLARNAEQNVVSTFSKRWLQGLMALQEQRLNSALAEVSSQGFSIEIAGGTFSPQRADNSSTQAHDNSTSTESTPGEQGVGAGLGQTGGPVTSVQSELSPEVLSRWGNWDARHDIDWQFLRDCPIPDDFAQAIGAYYREISKQSQ